VSRKTRQSFTGFDTFNDDFDKNFNRGFKGMLALMFLWMGFLAFMGIAGLIILVKVLQNYNIL
jgi:hypothetical protein